MLCAQCQRAVPDESLFCLHCGARVITADRVTSGNGAAAPRMAPDGATGTAAPPDRKQAYALSFQPVPDERVRYRLARWVCDVAPAHPLVEVQASLTRGGFTTFLAFTAEEADSARQHIEALGVHPSLVRLTPATPADMLAPPRLGRRPAATVAEWPRWQKLVAAGAGLLLIVVFALVALRLLGGRGF